LNPAEPIGPQVAWLGVVYIAVAVSVDVTYVLAAAALSRRFLGSRVAQRRMGRVSAATYVGLGVAAAATGLKEL
jgi:threonine/homoserine/homoserine lactone efflux protein